MPTVPPLAITDAERADACNAGSVPHHPSGPPNGPGSCCWPPMAFPTARGYWAHSHHFPSSSTVGGIQPCVFATQLNSSISFAWLIQHAQPHEEVPEPGIPEFLETWPSCSETSKR